MSGDDVFCDIVSGLFFRTVFSDEIVFNFNE